MLLESNAKIVLFERFQLQPEIVCVCVCVFFLCGPQALSNPAVDWYLEEKIMQFSMQIVLIPGAKNAVSAARVKLRFLSFWVQDPQL